MKPGDRVEVSRAGSQHRTRGRIGIIDRPGPKDIGAAWWVEFGVDVVGSVPQINSRSRTESLEWADDLQVLDLPRSLDRDDVEEWLAR